MEIDLGKGYIAIIDDEDADLVTGFKWYPMKTKEEKIYAAGWKHMPPGRFFVHLHRLIANAQPGDIIDHADRDPLNCRRSNLRRVTRQQNSFNSSPQRKQGTSSTKVYSYAAGLDAFALGLPSTENGLISATSITKRMRPVPTTQKRSNCSESSLI